MAGLSINEMTTYRWSFYEDVTRYKAAGIEAIGVWRQKLADFGEDKGIELLAESGLAVSNLLWAGGFTGDGHSYADALADAREALHLAGALGTSHLVVYSGSQNGHTRKHAVRLFQGALEKLLPLAEQLKITLDVEPMHPGCAQQWTFLTSLDDALPLVAQIGSPQVKVVFDTYQLGHDPRIVERIGEIVPWIGIVHLGDGKCPRENEQHRHRLGDGVIPLECIVGALKRAGYDGYYDVELIGEEIESCDYAGLLAGAQQCYQRLGL